jgi:hypothetical protein
MKAGIPDSSEMRETTGEKPFPRINIDSRKLLPSDSGMDWKMGKIIDKVNKLMRA